MKSFFKTDLEFQQHIMVGNGLDLAWIQPHITDSDATAEIVEILGQPFYDALLDIYHSGSPSANQSSLILHIQSALAPLSIYFYMQTGGINITSSGITTDRDNSAFQWQKRDAEQHYLRLAFKRLDTLITYLYQHKADFPDWANSDAYQLHREFFVNTPQQFNQWVNIANSYRTLKALKPSLREVQSSRIRPLLSPTLTNEILSRIRTNNPTADDTALLQFIEPALCLLAAADGMESLSFQLTAEGIYTTQMIANSSANIKETAPLSESQLERRIDSFRAKGNSYLEQLRQYLNQQASPTRYAAYYQSENYPSANAPNTYSQDATTKIFNAL